MTHDDLVFGAGLWEGEGCFCVTRDNRSERFRDRLAAKIEMTDLDVITWFRDTFAPGNHISCLIRKGRRANEKPTYVVHLTGAKAEALAHLLKPYLFQRRRDKIDEILAMDLSHHPRKAVTVSD